MSEISVADAEAFGMKLNKDQRALLEGDHRFAMALQVMPDPMPWVCEGGYVPYYACDSDVMTAPHGLTQVAMPVVLDLQGARDEVDSGNAYVMNNHYTQRSWDVLPTMYAFARDMAEIATGRDCGCDPTDQCGCYDHPPVAVISPYACVPLTDEEAKQLHAAAARDLPTGAYPALAEISEAHCGCYDPVDILEGLGIEVGEDFNPYGDPVEYAKLLELALEPAYEQLQWDPDNGMAHTTPPMVSYQVPDELQAKVDRLRRAHKRYQNHVTALFKRDARARCAARMNAFAYPTVDDPPLT